MSGGVDSSVATYLLKKQGYNVVGVFMRCYNLDGCAERDAEDARRVAEHVNIPFYVLNLEKEYKKKVVDYMVDSYKKGLTPNPDVMCNQEIKFGLFLDAVLKLGADYMATGHYVRIKKNASYFSLYAAKDQNKDQSYFLWTLAQHQLKHCLFPIGDYKKSEIREIARKAKLPTAEKKDSQGVCFLGDVNVKEFLKTRIPEKKGKIVNEKNQTIGKHEGAYFYTIGQRHGLYLGKKNHELGIRGKHETHPHYIAAKNIKTNTLVVAEGKNNPLLYKKEMEITNVNFIPPLSSEILSASRRTRFEIPVFARIRYRQPLTRAILSRLRTNNLNNYQLTFKEPQKFIAPGQSTVLYTETGELLGGGVIIK